MCRCHVTALLKHPYRHRSCHSQASQTAANGWHAFPSESMAPGGEGEVQSSECRVQNERQKATDSRRDPQYQRGTRNAEPGMNGRRQRIRGEIPGINAELGTRNAELGMNGRRQRIRGEIPGINAERGTRNERQKATDSRRDPSLRSG